MASQNVDAAPSEDAADISEESVLHEAVPPPTSNLRRSTRSRQVKANLMSPAVDVEEFLKHPATAEDRQNWKGWCEIESDPVGLEITRFDPH